ncbi:MAG: site-specific integrase [Solobacterium sp.]|nr:site-specific integrase [Solobacterium sp.]
MKAIIEKKKGNETFYEVQEYIDDKLINKRTVFCKVASINKKTTTYFIFYNSDMVPISDAFSFVNQYLAGKALNTRIKACEALKVLFCFEEIVGKQIKTFKASDINDLKYFLHGYSPSGQLLSLDLATIRSNDTINGYLSVYRNYLGYLGITDHSLFDTSGRITYPRDEIGSDFAYRGKNYKNNERSPKKVIEVPKYISVEEFEAILKYIRKKYSLREEIIVRLMYQCGLRIGEVLGLTFDDVVMEKSNDGVYFPIAYIRNRVSDKYGQFAKTCMKVFSRKQYTTSEYNTYGYGYQSVVLPRDLYDLINEYIETTHVPIRDNPVTNKRYITKSIADRVRGSELYEDDNYYIFINSIGTPFSIASWDDILRDIFKSVGIHVDKNRRKNNLNHRFRHGFAMFQVMYLGVKEVELAKLMRHSNLSSVLCYFQPTITDQIKLKTEFVESLYEVVPALRRTQQ